MRNYQQLVYTSLHDDVTKTVSHSGHRTDIKQGNELEMNRSSGSVYVPIRSLSSVLCTNRTLIITDDVAII